MRGVQEKEKLKKIRIEVCGIGKRFVRRFKKERKNFLEYLINPILNREKSMEFDAVKDVSFSVSEGEVLGLIGRNGSGKSTLLKLIAGIYTPTTGYIKTDGSVVYITGFGWGLKTKLTMKENIYLIGTIMGLNREEIDKKLEEIIDFSGLRAYLYTPVFQFSSGMISRLNFSIGIHCLEHKKPDILLFDEAFSAGGDIDFQEKSIKKMEEFIKEGATVVLVSHRLDLIEKYCNRVMLIENGKIIKTGSPSKIIEYYKNFTKKRDRNLKD